MNLVDSCGWLEYFSDGPNTNQMYNAIIWTQDADFKDLEGVKYIEKWEQPYSKLS